MKQPSSSSSSNALKTCSQIVLSASDGTLDARIITQCLGLLSRFGNLSNASRAPNKERAHAMRLLLDTLNHCLCCCLHLKHVHLLLGECVCVLLCYGMWIVHCAVLFFAVVDVVMTCLCLLDSVAVSNSALHIYRTYKFIHKSK